VTSGRTHDHGTTDYRTAASYDRSRLNSTEFPTWLVQFALSRSRPVFTKTDSPASLGALGVLGTSRRKIRSLRTAPAVLRSR
jgi:hypothetical protein